MPALLALLLLTLLTACKHQPDPAPAPTDTAPATLPFVAADVPAPKPTGPLPAKASCVTPDCHATFKTAAHIHGPVGLASCQSCHAPDQGGHKYPLLRTGNLMCTFCHVVSGTKAYQHKALEPTAVAPTDPAAKDDASAPHQGGCLACHDPHISKVKYLLVTDSVDKLCAKCHNLPLKKHAHDPFVKGQCTICHQPHQADSKSLLRNGDGPDHCYSCHAEKRNAIAQATYVHKPVTTTCTACHGPHATDNAKQLKQSVNDTCLSCHTKIKEQLATAKVVHSAITQGNCASCHDAHGSNQPDELKARTDKVCLTCHAEAIKTEDGRTIAAMGPVLASKNLHGPVKAGGCSQCHQPHAADLPNLLKLPSPDTFYAKFNVNDYALCFSCHDQQMVLRKTTTNLTGFRDGDKNLHFAHVNRDDKGRTCKTCHDVHGSNLPNHMAAAVPFEGSTWAMPIRYEPSATGGTCTPGCHDTRSYDRTKPVTPPVTTAPTPATVPQPTTIPTTTGGQP